MQSSLSLLGQSLVLQREMCPGTAGYTCLINSEHGAIFIMDLTQWLQKFIVIVVDEVCQTIYKYKTSESFTSSA